MSGGQWVVQPLSAKHVREGFDCGHDSLNEYLLRYAKANAKKDIGKIYVAVEPSEVRVCGYYTISSGSVARQYVPDAEKSKLPRYAAIPALHLGRLAVDRSQQGKHLGEYLLMHALALAERLAEEVAIRLIDVLAINDKATGFYLRYGFAAMEDEKWHLYLSIKTVRALGLND